MNYKVLLQYYSVLQSTSPVLLRTTKYYSSTTSYYKVLLQYYSVLQSTSPALLRTTPVLLRTTMNYKVLLQYYSVLQSTSPVLLRITMNYKVLLRTTKYYSITYETSFTMRGAAGVTIQPHQILRLSRRKTHLLNHHYI